MNDKYKNLPPRFPIPPDGAIFGPDGVNLDYQPKWKIPEKIGIACHVTGQPIKRAKKRVGHGLHRSKRDGRTHSCP